MSEDAPGPDDATAHRVYVKHRREAVFMAVLAAAFVAIGAFLLTRGQAGEGIAMFLLGGVQLLILRKWLQAMRKAREQGSPA